MDEAAAKRAAAAEARRQKILARGAERLNRITVGTPLVPGAPEEASNEDDAKAPATIESTGIPEPSIAATGPTTAASFPPPRTENPSAPLCAGPISSTVAQGETDSGSGSSEAERGPCTGDDASQAAAQLEADAAFHALLNQLAGAAAQVEQQQLRLAGAASSTGRGGQASAASTPLGRGRGLAGSAPVTSTAAAGGGPSTAAAALHPALAAILAALGALLGALLGPQLSAAVAATRRLRACLAVALAALLHAGVLEAAALRLPPVLALMVALAALIAGARMLAPRMAPKLRLSKSLSELNLAGASATGAGVNGSGDGDSAADADVAAAAPSPPPRFDWLSLAPGLRPLLESAASGVTLVSGMAADVSVFLTTYVVLGAAGQLGGGRTER